jgi:ribosomal-protein-alanine N-acetyltransferase
LQTSGSKSFWLRTRAIRRDVAIAKEKILKQGNDKEPQEAGKPCGFFASDGRLSFRPITSADLDEIMAIERTSFPYPWSPRFFLQELQVPCARSMLAEIQGEIVGYVLFWVLPDEVDIHNIAVRTEYRRRGIGRLLLHQVLAAAQSRGSTRVTLEVRKSNTAAQRLYQSTGFVTTGIRKGYYSDNGEDALAMALDLFT